MGQADNELVRRWLVLVADLGLNQTEAAGAIGVKQQAVSKWMRTQAAGKMVTLQRTETRRRIQAFLAEHAPGRNGSAASLPAGVILDSVSGVIHALAPVVRPEDEPKIRGTIAELETLLVRLGAIPDAGKAELTKIAVAELLARGQTEARAQGSPPITERRRLPRRRRGA